MEWDLSVEENLKLNKVIVKGYYGESIRFHVIAFYSIEQGKEVNEIIKKFVFVVTFIVILSCNVWGYFDSNKWYS